LDRLDLKQNPHAIGGGEAAVAIRASSLTTTLTITVTITLTINLHLFFDRPGFP